MERSTRRNLALSVVSGLLAVSIAVVLIAHASHASSPAPTTLAPTPDRSSTHHTGPPSAGTGTTTSPPKGTSTHDPCEEGKTHDRGIHADLGRSLASEGCDDDESDSDGSDGGDGAGHGSAELGDHDAAAKDGTHEQTDS